MERLKELNKNNEIGVAIVIAVVLFPLCTMGGWMYQGYNERTAIDARAKSETVQSMVNAGRPTREIQQVMAQWHPSADSSKQYKELCDKKAELAKALMDRKCPSADVVKIVNACYSEDDLTEEKLKLMLQATNK